MCNLPSILSVFARIYFVRVLPVFCLFVCLLGYFLFFLYFTPRGGQFVGGGQYRMSLLANIIVTSVVVSAQINRPILVRFTFIFSPPPPLRSSSSKKPKSPSRLCNNYFVPFFTYLYIIIII